MGGRLACGGFGCGALPSTTRHRLLAAVSAELLPRHRRRGIAVTESVISAAFAALATYLAFLTTGAVVAVAPIVAGGRYTWLVFQTNPVPSATFVNGLPARQPTPRARQTLIASQQPLQTKPLCQTRVQRSALREWKRYEGWARLNSRRSWDFLLGASPFSYEESLGDTNRQAYMDNLVWVEEVTAKRRPGAGGGKGGSVRASGDAEYPATFRSYLSRLLLARDERCASWWAGANLAAEESPEILFARFEASVARGLARNWSGRAGTLAAALIKRFGGRFPFDAVEQVRLCFSLLPEEMLRNSFFNQDFNTERDELMEVFLVMDADGNGVLSRQEIGDAFKAMGGWVSSAEIQEMLEDALANTDGEVDFAGFKDAIVASHTAPRYRMAKGIPVTEWWRDPAALVPPDLLNTASPEMLQDAHVRFAHLVRRALEEEEAFQEMPHVRPLSRERPLGPAEYALYSVAGAFACTITHVALVPIDVVKTLQQSEPYRFGGLGLYASVCIICREFGPAGLFLGLVPTLVGYAWYGATVFPGYEFFKRRLLALSGPRLASRIRVPLVLLSGALATVVACIGVCPAEAVRIRTVTRQSFHPFFLLPISSLFAGFAPLLFRQVLFGMAKFLVFDTFAALAFRRFPGLGSRTRSAFLVSLLSGAIAGFIATFVSQPSDAVLTRLATAPELGIAGAAASLWKEGRVAAFFAGFVTRSVWASAIIAGQFLLYDVVKHAFKVGASDLSQSADVLATALRTSESTATPVGGVPGKPAM